jgi:hypothetical protein
MESDQQTVTRAKNARQDESPLSLGTTGPTQVHFQVWPLREQSDRLVIPRQGPRQPTVLKGPRVVLVTRTPLRLGYTTSEIAPCGKEQPTEHTTGRLSGSSYDLEAMTFHEWRASLDRIYRPWPLGGREA